MSYPQGPQPPYQPPYPYRQPNPSNTLSIVGIALGGVAFLFLPPLFGIAGLICGVVAHSKGERLASTAVGVSVGGLMLGMALGSVVFLSGFGI